MGFVARNRHQRDDQTTENSSPVSINRDLVPQNTRAPCSTSRRHRCLSSVAKICVLRLMEKSCQHCILRCSHSSYVEDTQTGHLYWWCSHTGAGTPCCSCVRYKSYFKSLHGWLGTAKERFEGWAEMSSPVGVCSTPVSLPDNKVAAEFALWSDCTRHVILGFNFRISELILFALMVKSQSIPV